MWHRGSRGQKLTGNKCAGIAVEEHFAVNDTNTLLKVEDRKEDDTRVDLVLKDSTL